MKSPRARATQVDLILISLVAIRWRNGFGGCHARKCVPRAMLPHYLCIVSPNCLALQHATIDVWVQGTPHYVEITKLYMINRKLAT